MGNKIIIGLIQPSIKPYAVQHNLEDLALKLRQLKSQNVRLAVLPEFFPTGNTLEPELLKVAIQSSDTVKKWLLDQSRTLDMFIAGSYLSLEGEDIYNKFVFQEPNGNISYHFKTQSPAPESIYYRVAQEKEFIVKTKIGKIGLIICVESFYQDIIELDYSDCSLILIDFAIPNIFGRLPAVRRRLTKVPEMLAKRNGVPVVLCSMGGKFHSNGSPIFPLKIRLRGVYVGRSGIYSPTGSVAGLLSSGEDGILVAEVPLGPKVESSDPSLRIETGLPIYMRVIDTLFKQKAEKIYQTNLKRWLQVK
ncbi:MAG: carbon-nitrogen hydrolase family protein [Promethearchaeota archaeon]